MYSFGRMHGSGAISFGLHLHGFFMFLFFLGLFLFVAYVIRYFKKEDLMKWAKYLMFAGITGALLSALLFRGEWEGMRGYYDDKDSEGMFEEMEEMMGDHDDENEIEESADLKDDEVAEETVPEEAA